MKILTILIPSVLAIVLIVACRQPVNTFTIGKVTGGELRSPSQSLFAHISEEHYLNINGKVYRHVAGGKPFYLDIPALHSVLFVTGSEEKGNVEFHVVEPATGHEIAISGGTIHFGTDIGAPRKPGQAYTDFVLAATSNEVTLASQYPNARVLIVLNLASKKVNRVVREPLKAQ